MTRSIQTIFVADNDPLLACNRIRGAHGLQGWRTLSVRGWKPQGPAARLISPNSKIEILVVSNRAGDMEERLSRQGEHTIKINCD